MTANLIDRVAGLSEGLAVKAPVRAATIANITLAGLQTIDGIAVTEGDAVLVWQQTTASENGVYLASSGNWPRRSDFDGQRDIVKGTHVFVTDGVTQSGFQFYVSTAPAVIGSDSIEFLSLMASGGSSAPGQGTLTVSGTFSVEGTQEWHLTDVSGSSSPVTMMYAQHDLQGSVWHGQHVTLGITSYLHTDPAAGTTFNNILPLQTNSFGLVPVTLSKKVDVFGANWYVTIAAGATGYDQAIGHEIDVGISATGSATSRIGLAIMGAPPQNGAVGDNGRRGTVTDVAYLVDRTGSSVCTWGMGYAWGAGAFDNTSTIIGGFTTNALFGIDFSNVTFSTAAFKSTGFQINPDGSLASTNHTVSGDLDVTDGTSRLRLIGAGGANFIESGNAAFNASANLSITGYLGNTLSTLSLVASTVSLTGTPSYALASGALAVAALAPLDAATHTVAASKNFNHYRLSQADGSNNIFTVAASAVVAGFASYLESASGSDATSNLYAAIATAQNDGPGTVKALHANAVGSGTSSGTLIAVNGQVQPVATQGYSSAFFASLTSTGVNDKAVGYGIESNGDRYALGVGNAVAALPIGTAYYRAWMATSSSANARAFQILNNAGTEIAYWGKDGSIVSPGFSVDGSGNVTALTHKVGANQVVGARDTGWAAMTGTPDKATAFATSTVTLAQLAGRVMAMQTALTTHGLLGA